MGQIARNDLVMNRLTGNTKSVLHLRMRCWTGDQAARVHPQPRNGLEFGEESGTEDRSYGTVGDTTVPPFTIQLLDPPVPRQRKQAIIQTRLVWRMMTKLKISRWKVTDYITPRPALRDARPAVVTGWIVMCAHTFTKMPLELDGGRRVFGSVATLPLAGIWCHTAPKYKRTTVTLTLIGGGGICTRSL